MTDNIIRIMSTPKGANYVIVQTRESLSMHALNAQVQSICAAAINRTIASIILRRVALSYYRDLQDEVTP